MESENSLRGFFYKTRNRLWTNNTLVLLICMLIAFIFWLLSALSRSYVTDITVDIIYINKPQDKVVVNKLPDQMDLQVRSTGWMLLREMFNIDEFNIAIDVDKFSAQEVFYPNAQIDYLENQIPSPYEIINAQPTVIGFSFDERSTKQVPVALQSQITLDPLYGFTDTIKIEPDKVTITGPKVVVDTIDIVRTKPLQLDKLKESKTGTVGLDMKYSSVINYSLEQVQYTINIEPYTETSVEVPITVTNRPSNNIMLVTKNATVSFQIPLKNFEMVKQQTFKESFTVAADFSEIDTAASSVKLKITDIPEMVKRVQVSPKEVNFLYVNQ